MATDGKTPPPCDPEIFEKGEAVFMTHTIPSNAMEGWVQKVAKRSGQRVDWHFMGGRAVVMALGDIDLVKKAIEELMPEHDRLKQEATDKILNRRTNARFVEAAEKGEPDNPELGQATVDYLHGSEPKKE